MMSMAGWHLVQSTCFALLMILLTACLRHRSAAARHGLMLAAVLKFLLPWQWLVESGAWLAVRMEGSFTLHGAPLSFALFAMQVRDVRAVPFTAMEGLADTVSVCVWFAGAAVLLALWLRRLLRPVDTSPQVTCGGDWNAVREVAGSIGLRHVPRLRWTETWVEPCLYGLLGMTIVLPRTLSEGLTAVQRDAVLAHELAHAKRRDNLARVLVHATVCVFWFHPLLWWMERWIDAEAEAACDDMVLAMGAAAESYRDAILRVCQMCVLQQIAGCSSVSGTTNRSSLGERMQRIMSTAVCRRDGYMVRRSGAALFTLSMAVTVASGFGGGVSGRAQDAHGVPETGSRSCAMASKAYPQGSVIRYGNQGQMQQCSLKNGRLTWVKTTEAKRDRSRPVIAIADTPQPPEVPCQQTAPEGKLCTCKGLRYSPGAVVGSESGPLVCPVSGGRWQPYEGMQKPWPPAAIAAR